MWQNRPKGFINITTLVIFNRKLSVTSFCELCEKNLMKDCVYIIPSGCGKYMEEISHPVNVLLEKYGKSCLDKQSKCYHIWKDGLVGWFYGISTLVGLLNAKFSFFFASNDMVLINDKPL